MTDKPESGKADALTEPHFIERLGKSIELTEEQQKIYFSLPDYHRALLEQCVARDDLASAIQWSLEILFNKEHEHNERATELWNDFLWNKKRIKIYESLSTITTIFYPLYALHRMKGGFDKVINRLIDLEVIEKYEGTVNQFGTWDNVKIRLDELEAVAEQYLALRERLCVKVWRGYVEDAKQALVLAAQVRDNDGLIMKKPVTRSGQQAEVLKKIQQAMPEASKKEIFAACQEKTPELFSVSFERFKQIWREVK